MKKHTLIIIILIFFISTGIAAETIPISELFERAGHKTDLWQYEESETMYIEAINLSEEYSKEYYQGNIGLMKNYIQRGDLTKAMTELEILFDEMKPVYNNLGEEEKRYANQIYGNLIYVYIEKKEYIKLETRIREMLMLQRQETNDTEIQKAIAEIRKQREAQEDTRIEIQNVLNKYIAGMNEKDIMKVESCFESSVFEPGKASVQMYMDSYAIINWQIIDYRIEWRGADEADIYLHIKAEETPSDGIDDYYIRYTIKEIEGEWKIIG